MQSKAEEAQPINAMSDDEESLLEYRTLTDMAPHDQHEKRSRSEVRLSEGLANNHLFYLGKVDLPHHPVRMRYLPHSAQRYLLYGKNGYQEMTVSQSPDQFYSLQEISWETLVCDCVQTSDLMLYMIARCHTSAVLGSYDEFMFAQNMVEIRYPLGCLSSLTTNLNCTHLYATNQELNCLLRFSTSDLDLAKFERFGTLWRPFDSCTSQEFNEQGGDPVQFLFVSNLDAGICVFNLKTMEMVTECVPQAAAVCAIIPSGDDLSPGAKYLAYDPKRSLLFVSSSCDRLLRCYRFEFQTEPPPKAGPAPVPNLAKIGDFLVAKRRSGVACCGPQCVMWDPETEHLAVVGWSQARGKFCVRLFEVNV